MRMRSVAAALLAPVHVRALRMLSSAVYTGAVPVHAVTPLSELLQRVRMAEVHTAVPHLPAEPAGSGAVPSSYTV